MPDIEYPEHVKRELSIDLPVRHGNRGKRVRRVQEWLTFSDFATPIDGDFGDATQFCVSRFQESRNLSITGIVDEATWEQLVAPLKSALAPLEPLENETLSALIVRYARQHLAQRPIELGGDNCGAWVRIYMGGEEGEDWRWCAGFVTFVMKQACATLERPLPIEGSDSCDSLADQAREADLFRQGRDIESGQIPWASLGSAQIFLVRNGENDYTHTGFSFDGQERIFSTIEGNTNDEGQSNGYEVCQRTRSLKDKDFIYLPG